MTMHKVLSTLAPRQRFKMRALAYVACFQASAAGASLSCWRRLLLRVSHAEKGTFFLAALFLSSTTTPAFLALGRASLQASKSLQQLQSNPGLPCLYPPALA